MKKPAIFLLIVSVLIFVSCGSKQGKNSDAEKITFVQNEAEKKIDILAGGKWFTTFRWPDNICKPVFYPILSESGTEITRGFPLNPKAGERADHPHQIGLWLTYGNVNGLDFWGNGSKGPGTTNPNGGIIRHLKTDDFREGTGEGSFVSYENWVDTADVVLLKEKTEYRFKVSDNIRIIDRIETLTAGDREISMPDTKEGMFGIRVARQLELPVKGNVELYNTDRTVTRVSDTLNIGITGNYTSSEGITGEAVWGTRARWMILSGTIGDENVSVAICDHPENPNYPTYWHARGYGLFSANPLGVRDFTQGKEELNFKIPAGGSATFRYRVIISSGKFLTEEEMNEYADDFAH